MIVVSFIIVLMTGFSNKPVYAASNSSNMKKLITAYKKGDISRARKYNKKLSKYANESCVKKMSKEMKKGYKKKVKKYISKYKANYNGKYVWDYYLTDINNDKKAELIIQYGSCEADVRIDVYQYKKGRVVKVGSTYCAHTSFSAYQGHNGIVLMDQIQGWERMYLLTMKNGKLKRTYIGERSDSSEGKFITYLSLRCKLKSHVSYDKNYERHYNLKDLQ